MQTFEVPEIDYTEYSNRELAAVPLVVLALALAVLGGWYLLYGMPVSPGIDFTGGTELTVQTSTPRSEIGAAFDQDPVSIQAVQSQPNQYIVTFQSTDESLDNQAQQELEPVETGTGDPPDIVQSSAFVTPAFGAAAQRAAVFGVLIAFAGMSVVAFALFRTFVPSVAIVLSAFSDIVIPIAVMNVLGIKLSLGTVAALLMLIGYSVDSDILLNNHVLRRSGGFYESTYRAMRTGVTMTLTSLAAMAVMAVVAFYFQISLLSSIGIVLVVGLAADLMNTYLLNLSLLRWYKFEGVAR